ncbi:ribosomal protein S10 [Gloeophyllum trabeum ATCC 11539]|uniref:Small ribosomal subunit protein uS10m n=1 Tax=Gloeophyllum trabeum (strain ATCC 11539 / FP-39264 / Madison 617) TaxID=670483 RepID=S7RKJ8_GLOTA|nr:ribosomal protein S10 [Gloeophyllum trabeum ATCC 11539]EPQ53194.1 ribosomal protein S10 [Gloeophyllum trabeum ATCC 11539]
MLALKACARPRGLAALVSRCRRGYSLDAIPQGPSEAESSKSGRPSSSASSLEGASQNWLQSLTHAAGGFSEEKWASTVVHGRSVHEPLYHARTHDIPVATVHFRSYAPPLMDLFVHFASHAASALGIPLSRPVHLPTQRSLWTVPRSPFVHKKSQENFERKVHKRLVKAWDADPQVIERWVRYLERHAMPGVGMRIVRWERAPVGIGEKVLKNAVEGMRVSDKHKMQALGEQIVKNELASQGTEVVQTPTSASS